MFFGWPYPHIKVSPQRAILIYPYFRSYIYIYIYIYILLKIQSWAHGTPIVLASAENPTLRSLRSHCEPPANSKIPLDSRTSEPHARITLQLAYKLGSLTRLTVRGGFSAAVDDEGPGGGLLVVVRVAAPGAATERRLWRATAAAAVFQRASRAAAVAGGD